MNLRFELRRGHLKASTVYPTDASAQQQQLGHLLRREQPIR